MTDLRKTPLTEDERADIRRRCVYETALTLARAYRVSEGHIYRLTRGIRRQHPWALLNASKVEPKIRPEPIPCVFSRGPSRRRG